MRVTLRPLPEWPYEATPAPRRAQFASGGRWVGDGRGGKVWRNGRRIGYDQTLRELEYEIDMLDGDDVVIGVGLGEADIRLDGAPRANARPMRHHGVGAHVVAPVVVTKGLEALRAIDRWGVAKRGQQYAGFALLTAGPSQVDLGRQLVEQHGSVAEALRATHPDTGGPHASTRDFQAVIAYRNGAG